MSRVVASYLKMVNIARSKPTIVCPDQLFSHQETNLGRDRIFSYQTVVELVVVRVRVASQLSNFPFHFFLHHPRYRAFRLRTIVSISNGKFHERVIRAEKWFSLSLPSVLKPFFPVAINGCRYISLSQHINLHSHLCSLAAIHPRWNLALMFYLSHKSVLLTTRVHFSVQRVWDSATTSSTTISPREFYKKRKCWFEAYHGNRSNVSKSDTNE